MADITVRKIRFAFDGPIDFDVPDDDLAMMLGALGLSMTMPYLEPYLIRTMKVAIKQISDPVLAEDARRFSQQEGHQRWSSIDHVAVAVSSPVRSICEQWPWCTVVTPSRMGCRNSRNALRPSIRKWP